MKRLFKIILLCYVLVGCVNLQAELIGHWKFDGNLNDSVGTNHGTPNGNASANADGVLAGAAEFDGVGDSIIIPTPALSGTSWSILWWSYSPAGSSNTGYMVSSGDPSGFEVMFFRRFNAAMESFSGGITQDTNVFPQITLGEPQPYPRGQWHHHAILHDGSTNAAFWYIDGELWVDPEGDHTNITNFIGFDSVIYVGDRKSGGREFEGRIDDLRFYNHVLEELEIQQIMTPNLAILPEPPNNATGISPDVVLSWWPPAEIDNPKYNVYMDEDDPNGNPIATEITATLVDPDPDLEYDTTYKWQVDVIDPNDGNPVINTGRIWTFTTGGSITNPMPANGAVLANPIAQLSWQSDELADAFDIYFGTDPNVALPFLGTVTQSDTSSLTLPDQDPFTTYYWCVDSKSNGTVLVQGEVWQFKIGGLIGHWPFDGNLTDAVGTSDGTAEGDASVGSDNGLFGGAANFDGVGDNIQIPTDALSGRHWTISWWANSPVSSTNTGYMVSSGDPSGFEVLFVRRTTGNRYNGAVTFGDDNGSFGDSAPYARGHWHHHVVTNDDSGTARWYIDGGTEVLLDGSVFDNFDTLFYMGDRKSGGRAFEGMIDDLMFYEGSFADQDAWHSYQNSPFAKEPIPQDGAVDVLLDINLRWTAGVGAETHDVYLGTDQTMVANATRESIEFKANVSETVFQPEVLEGETTYYWVVDEVIGEEIIKGQVWVFTTGEGCFPPLTADLTDDCIVNMEDFAVLAGEWLKCNLLPQSNCP